MISVLGTVALAATAGLAAAAAVAWSMATPEARRAEGGPANGQPAVELAEGRWNRMARWATVGMWVAAAAAVALMQWALIGRDFSVAYVAETGSREMPLYYTITALWAGPGGSLLFWVFVLSTVVLALCRWVPARLGSTYPAGMAVLTVMVGAFGLLTLVGAAPFQAMDVVPTDGPGPNPLLRDHPAMGIHPPILYAGFAALAVPFALAAGALLAGRVDGPWARAVRGWTLAGWAFLGAGIALGAWWSYAVLGWGGYWAWDPVENVSLMPWLLATALLHIVGAGRRTGGWAVAATALAGAAFLLVLLGTLLTRSGAVLSVHAFSESPLGPPLLVIFGVVTAGWAALMIWRRDRLTVPSESASVLSRHTALRAQNVLLVLITATILLGTVLPVLAQALTGDRLSVGAPWFNRTLGPPALAVLALMAVGPLTAWDRDDPTSLLRRMRAPGVLGLAAVGVTGFAGPGGVMLPVAAGLTAFVVSALVVEVTPTLRRHTGLRRPSRRRVGALVAHGGILLAALAVVGTSYGTSAQQEVAIGEPVVVGSSSATLLGLERFAEDGRTVAAAPVLLGIADRPVATVSAELHYYPAHGMVVASPAVRSGLGRDMQVALLDVEPDDGTATVRLTVTPMLTWLWVGAAVTILGGLITALPARALPGRRRTHPTSTPVRVRQTVDVP